MKRLLTIATIITLLWSCAPKVKEAITIPPQMEQTVASIHIVNKDESLYKIAMKYGITRKALIDMNPILNQKELKKGMKLYIPFPTQEKEETKPDTVVVEKPKVEEKKSNAIKAAIILPFMLNQYAPGEQERMIEFYQGLLLAVEELKGEGHSFDIYTYDSGESTKSLDTLIGSGALNGCDIIIGALYPTHNKALATFAKTNNIPLVLPFSAKEDELYSNPKVFITNALQTYTIEKSISKFPEQFPGANIIFVDDNHEGEKKEFAVNLQKYATTNNINHRTILIDSLMSMASGGSTAYIREQMDTAAMNIFIPTNSKQETFNRILPTLLVLKRDTLDAAPQFALFGYPEWQIYAGSNLEAMYEVDTYFYTSFYTNSILPEAIDIQNKYTEWYNRSMQNRYPRYGMLGYDTGYYFLKAISRYRGNLTENINKVEFNPTQSGYYFTRKNNRGSYINTKAYYIRYSPDYKVTKIDLDK